jgi:hypothetical protein
MSFPCKTNAKLIVLRQDWKINGGVSVGIILSSVDITASILSKKGKVKSLDFSIDPKFPAALWPWDRLSL